jgi:hypothetical protein
MYVTAVAAILDITAAILLQPNFTGERAMAREAAGGTKVTAAPRAMATTQLHGGTAVKT